MRHFSPTRLAPRRDLRQPIYRRRIQAYQQDTALMRFVDNRHDPLTLCVRLK